VIERAAQKADMERFNVKNLNEGVIKNSIGLQLETSLQLWKSQRTMLTSRLRGTILGKTKVSH
jgi:hypothetical protein